MKPNYTPQPDATTKTLLIFRDECGLLMANDVELGSIIGEGYGRHCLTDHRANKLAASYKARGFNVIWGI